VNKHLAIAAFSACAFAALFETGRIEPRPAHAATDEQKKLKKSYLNTKPAFR
jgi:hypothetical protein